MPGYKGHLTGGAAIYGALLVAIIYLIQKPTIMMALEWLAFALAGSLFPDIDTKSKGQQFFYRIVLLVFVLLVIQRQCVLLSFLSIIALLPMLVHHRGLFHRGWFVIGFPVLTAAFCVYYAPHYAHIIWYDVLFFIAGALSHLWLDMGWRRMWRI